MQAAMQAGEETAPPSTAGPHTATSRTNRRPRSRTTLFAILCKEMNFIYLKKTLRKFYAKGIL
jgi:hypothetical protein